MFLVVLAHCVSLHFVCMDLDVGGVAFMKLLLLSRLSCAVVFSDVHARFLQRRGFSEPSRIVSLLVHFLRFSIGPQFVLAVLPCPCYPWGL